MRLLELPARVRQGEQFNVILVFDVAVHPAFSCWAWGRRTGAKSGSGVAAGKATAVLRGHTRPVRALAISRDGKYLASGCAEGVLKLWDVVSARELLSRRLLDGSVPIRALAFTSDGRKLVLGGGERRGWVKVWELIEKP
jgi:WD40 repeat protein